MNSFAIGSKDRDVDIQAVADAMERRGVCDSKQQ